MRGLGIVRAGLAILSLLVGALVLILGSDSHVARLGMTAAWAHAYNYDTLQQAVGECANAAMTLQGSGCLHRTDPGGSVCDFSSFALAGIAAKSEGGLIASRLRAFRENPDTGAIRFGGASSRLTNAQADDLANWLGYTRTNFRSSNQPVFRRGNSYITQDIDSHIGGTWKMDSRRIRPEATPWYLRLRTQLDRPMNPLHIWGLDLADASEQAARFAAGLLGDQGIETDVIDPSRWLTWHLDRASVEGLLVAMRAALASGQLTDDRITAGVESLLEDCERWLEAARQNDV